MQIPISTKIERAWYVDPELWAADYGPGTDVEIAAHSAEPRDATLTLGDDDLEEARDVVRVGDEARHYKAVSLRGALLINDEDSTASPRRSLVERFNAASLPARFESAGTAVVRFIEGGRRSPLKLAAVSFGAGVGTTLIGVLLAL